MISSNEIITGEKIQLECEHFIGNSGCIINPKIINEAQSRFLTNDIVNINFDNKANIFCYTHTLNTNELVSFLNKFKNEFNLFFHNSDHAFDVKHLKLFSKIPKLKKIYTQNKNVIDDRVKILPIGIANTQWSHGNLQCWDNLKFNRLVKSKDFFFNFKIPTNKYKRQQCYDIIKNKNIKWINNTNYSNYLNILQEYKFAFCPEGNGIDTHRFWECIYLGVIPISLKNIMVEELQKDLPILILDKWEDFDPEKVITTYDNYNWENVNKYTMSYIKKYFFTNS